MYSSILEKKILMVFIIISSLLHKIYDFLRELFINILLDTRLLFCWNIFHLAIKGSYLRTDLFHRKFGVWWCYAINGKALLWNLSFLKWVFSMNSQYRHKCGFIYINFKETLLNSKKPSIQVFRSLTSVAKIVIGIFSALGWQIKLKGFVLWLKVSGKIYCCFKWDQDFFWCYLKIISRSFCKLN